tara:strand:- start:622 stop:822 length:201 start_codon:yes stop_codon:yes gene_type:complete
MSKHDVVIMVKHPDSMYDNFEMQVYTGEYCNVKHTVTSMSKEYECMSNEEAEAYAKGYLKAKGNTK